MLKLLGLVAALTAMWLMGTGAFLAIAKVPLDSSDFLLMGMTLFMISYILQKLGEGNGSNDKETKPPLAPQG